MPDQSETYGPSQAVAGPAGTAPLRPHRSIRRTSTIDMSWPDGIGTATRMHGSARDAVTTRSDSAPAVVDSAGTDVAVAMDRTIEAIESTPKRDGIEQLVGCRGGGHLRSALDEVLPGERESGSPLYLLLDDISGASLISGFAWSRHVDLFEVRRERMAVRPSMEGVCIGLRPGSTALGDDGLPNASHRVQPVGPLVHPEDPDGWHDLPELPDVSMRRARRIDVWVDDLIRIDSAFQDSAGDPEHGRVAIHEYQLGATADPLTQRLVSVEPDPRVLPFLECPQAAEGARALVGVALGDLRSTVLERLARTKGCTHLNDALRALAEVPVLLQHLAAVDD